MLYAIIGLIGFYTCVLVSVTRKLEAKVKDLQGRVWDLENPTQKGLRDE